MANIEYWRQTNSDIAHVQGGTSQASNDAYVIGAKSGRPTLIPFEDIRRSFSLASSSHITFFDHFYGVGATTPAPWSVAKGSTGTAVPSGAAGEVGGCIRLTTAANADDDYVTLALGNHWQVGKGTTGLIHFEARVKLGAITAVAFEIGLSDAISQPSGLAFSDHTVAGVTDVATNAAVFAFDTDGSLTNWTINTSKSGVPQALDTGVVVAAEFYVFNITIWPEGHATFYINDTYVGNVSNAIAVNAAVGPWATVVTRVNNAAKTADIDYIGIVGDMT